MSLLCLRPPVGHLETRERGMRTSHLLLGFGAEPFSSSCIQRCDFGEVRHVCRRFVSTCRVSVAAGQHRLQRRCRSHHSRSLSSLPILSRSNSVSYRAIESVVASRPWEARVSEENGGLRTECCCQRSERQDWGLQWEGKSIANVQSKVDDEKASTARDSAVDDTSQNIEQDSAPVGIRQSATSRKHLERMMEVAVSAVQLAISLSQRTQQKIIQKEETADEKTDRSLVTVADWGVQAVVSWVLAQGLEGEAIPLIAEEDTNGLRGSDKVDLLQRVVEGVNLCLQEAKMVGICPPAHPMNGMDILNIIGKGNAEGGKKGRYWVLDPVDGTLGFVRGDQYAIALGLIEDGEVVLAVLGCPNFPLRKEWLRYHHRYYRLAAKLHPPNPGKWHKGLVLTTTKGSGQVMMQPLVVDDNGSPRLPVERPRPVRVSSIDDPAKATFCEPFEKANSRHSFTAGLAETLGLRNRPLRVYSLAKYAAIARGDAEIFMKFARSGYKEKIWDHAAGVLIVQEAGGVVTDAGGKPLDFSQGRFLTGLDRGIIACSGETLLEKLLKAVYASWDSSTL